MFSELVRVGILGAYCKETNVAGRDRLYMRVNEPRLFGAALCSLLAANMIVWTRYHLCTYVRIPRPRPSFRLAASMVDFVSSKAWDVEYSPERIELMRTCGCKDFNVLAEI